MGSLLLKYLSYLPALVIANRIDLKKPVYVLGNGFFVTIKIIRMSV